MSQSAPLDQELQAALATLTETGQHVLEPARAALEDRWQQFQSSAVSAAASTDVNALVLLVLREAIREAREDVSYFLLKLQSYNDVSEQLERALGQPAARGGRAVPTGTSDPHQQALLAVCRRVLAGEVAVLRQQAALLQKRTEQLGKALGDVPA